MLALGFLRASSELKTCVTYSKYMADGLAQRNIFRIEIFYVPFGSVYSMYFFLGRGIDTYQNSKYSRIVIYTDPPCKNQMPNPEKMRLHLKNKGRTDAITQKTDSAPKAHPKKRHQKNA